MQENPNAFKNLINPTVVKKISSAIFACDPKFKSAAFLKLIPQLDSLELKERVLLITKYIEANLKSPYPESIKILMNAMEKGDLKGFELWPFSEFISQFGLDHFDESMKAMCQLTQRFTSEFAVRPFILKDHKKVLKYFIKWSKDKNVHIRRWVSEGSRPLLPWGQRIPLFVMDPTHTILLLDKLRFDEELYVRKSVANHLNDISKNHPQVVIEILRLWAKDVPAQHEGKLQWITRHALRTLIKKGHPGALKLLGVEGSADIKLKKFKLNKNKFKLNDVLIFSFEIESTSHQVQKLIIDYSIDFLKANGKKGKKIFKLKTLEIGPQEKISIEKKHSLKPITTMTFYSGSHHLNIQVNGNVLGENVFVLKI